MVGRVIERGDTWGRKWWQGKGEISRERKREGKQVQGKEHLRGTGRGEAGSFAEERKRETIKEEGRVIRKSVEEKERDMAEDNKRESVEEREREGYGGGQ